MFVSHSPPPPINCYNRTSNTTYPCIYSHNKNDSDFIVLIIIGIIGLIGLIIIYFVIKQLYKK
jgi:hypothetical protein